jgi:GrpB-like predicted nucleotidyltransferase (UPF0157 family)
MPWCSPAMKRARFRADERKKRVDVFLINEESGDWTNCVIFENFLKDHPEWLEKYRILKEKGNGLTVREYYRRKNSVS